MKETGTNYSLLLNCTWCKIKPCFRGLLVCLFFAHKDGPAPNYMPSPVYRFHWILTCLTVNSIGWTAPCHQPCSKTVILKVTPRGLRLQGHSKHCIPPLCLQFQVEIQHPSNTVNTWELLANMARWSAVLQNIIGRYCTQYCRKAKRNTYQSINQLNFYSTNIPG